MSESSLTIAASLALAAELQATSDTARLDVELLLCHVLHKNRAYLHTWSDRPLTADQQQQLLALLARRQRGEPVAHLLGWQGFWSLELAVNDTTLIPRPETELLVEIALELLPATPCRVVDLGTGTGAIALALATERRRWQLVAVDRVAEAVALAEHNRSRLKLDNVEVKQGCWFELLDGQFDLVVSNPPYIDEADPHLQQGDVRYEPHSALVADAAGLADIQHIVATAPAYLRPTGWLLLEHGWEQGEAVQALLRKHGYQAIETHKDLEGRDRVTAAQWPGR